MAQNTGRRFKIYVQSPAAGERYKTPEPITIALPSSQIGAGLTDSRVYVLDAVKSRYANRTPHAYNEYDGRPWNGNYYASTQPSPDGHFDHLQPDAHPREFAQANVYATVRFVLKIWDDYYAQAGGGPIEWHHKASTGIDGRLELNPWSETNGARAGYGFLEFGTGLATEGFRHRGPLWNNFDVIAHELGHSILFSKLGFPRSLTRETDWYACNNKEFLAFHESAGDLVAIVSCLHHQTVIEDVLFGRQPVATSVAELGKLDAMFAVRSATDRRAVDEVDRNNVHEYSVPLTAAIYGAYAGACTDEAKSASDAQSLKRCLANHRDYLGRLLAKTWNKRALPPDSLTYSTVKQALLTADTALGGRYANYLQASFRERGIR